MFNPKNGRNELLQPIVARTIIRNWAAPDKVEVIAKQLLRGQVQMFHTALAVDHEGRMLDPLQCREFRRHVGRSELLGQADNSLEMRSNQCNVASFIKCKWISASSAIKRKTPRTAFDRETGRHKPFSLARTRGLLVVRQGPALFLS